CRRRDEVEAPRPDRGRNRHDLAATPCLGEGNGGVCHRLLVVSSPGRKDILHRFQGLTDTGDIAVSEDGEYAGNQRSVATAVGLDSLCDQKADQSLGGGGTNSPHLVLPFDRLAIHSYLSSRSEEHTSELQSRENLVC